MLKFLGHVLMPGMLKPDYKKVQAVSEFPVPEHKRAVQQFLGLAGYYRKFIKDFATVVKPLSDLTKDVPWEWTTEAAQAFDDIRSLLEDAAGLRLPDLNREFVIQTDASGVGLGAVLMQEHENQLYPIYLASSGLTPAERNYSVPQL